MSIVAPFVSAATPTSAFIGRFGPHIDANAVATLRLWAPRAKEVELLLEREFAMNAVGDGWFELAVAAEQCAHGYRFRVDRTLEIPDPASRFQPADVNGPSALVTGDYDWQMPQWQGRPWEEAVILELHVGTFTAEGNFRGVIAKLDEVAAAGFTAIELMPIADFIGRRNWGYDGVLWFAPDHTYGTPDDLKALIDAAHVRGLMIFLDVVYNHFGPAGNYLHQYAPQFFTSDRCTPWGDAIDYRVPEVRAFAIQNALYWLHEYRFDGLRLDAVHAIVEPGELHLLEELSIAVGDLAAMQGRRIHLMLENDDNRASLLDPGSQRPCGKYRAQWNDDYHHAWHVLLTHEASSYYFNYADAPLEHLCRALSSGYAYQGETLRSAPGKSRGESSAHLPPTAFINFLQNHDQIGNRAHGDRLSALAPERQLQAALEVTLLAPMPPLLFMGEEWGTRKPFAFFCDFAGELADAVRRGRREEFAALFENAPATTIIPDPLDEQTFKAAVLDWSEPTRSPHRERLDLVRRLLQVRRHEVVPRMHGMEGFAGYAGRSDKMIHASWRMADGTRLVLLANLQDVKVLQPSDIEQGRQIWGSAYAPIEPWSVRWYLR